MRHTGERYLPELDGADISYEHWHRYLLAAQCVAGKRVLDVASGEGYGSALLARTAASVVGIDLDPEAVAYARAKYPAANLTFDVGNAAEIPVAGEHEFDVITSFETLEHLSADDQRRFMAEAKRLLRPGGRLLISTPNRLIYTDRGQSHNPFHLREFDPGEFVAFLAEFFPAVRVLSQHVYTGSYIWDAADPAGPFAEYQLQFADGQYQPAAGDRKEQLYLVAVCSDAPVDPAGTSLLLDLDGASGAAGFVSTLFVDTGSGYRAEESRCQRLPPGPGRFRLTFALAGVGPVRGVRWDPLELRTCRVRLDGVEWADGAGRVHRADPGAAAANGDPAGGGVVAFDTLDPMVYLPVAGDVARVTVDGWYEADDAPASAARVDAAIQAARGQAERLRDLDGQVRALADALTAARSELAAVRMLEAV